MKYFTTDSQVSQRGTVDIGLPVGHFADLYLSLFNPHTAEVHFIKTSCNALVLWTAMKISEHTGSRNKSKQSILMLATHATRSADKGLREMDLTRECSMDIDWSSLLLLYFWMDA